MFPDKILDQKGKRSVAGIAAKNLNRVCELHSFTLSMLISQLEGFYAVYIVDCFCFKEIHNGIFRSDKASHLQIALSGSERDC